MTGLTGSGAMTVEEESGSDQPPSRLRLVGRDAAAVLGCFLLLGVACGVLWWLAVEPAHFTKVGGDGSMGELEMARRFDVEGWYVVIGILAGLGAGVVLTAWRSRDFLLTTVLVAVGAGLAAAAMAWTGHTLGPGDTDEALDVARAGQLVPVELRVSMPGSYLVWPMAALVGALVVLWSPPQDANDEL